jgi:hypothetical protein
MTGSEDGRLLAWDLNSQKVLASRQLSASKPATNEEASFDGDLKSNPAKQDKTRCSVKSLDYSKNSGLAAVSNGSEECGVRLFNLSDLLETEHSRKDLY